MGFLSWLVPGNDHQLAATQYEGRESASDRAARRRREDHHKNLTRNARKQQAREDKFWRNL
ncbi:hypothetical protein [Streptomyces sp. NBC_01373]|uniref:hypothetical protein n=1 Tax=Streptomyces sp. NBC_01373 TaxID=2903843 RepID=UPI00224ECEA7|nr:hypothetical protein [Streptomyces sp. NBC_01373]MCX4703890.1 hypothetical protein [Streptomyces sp. NBC_01373]